VEVWPLEYVGLCEPISVRGLSRLLALAAAASSRWCSSVVNVLQRCCCCSCPAAVLLLATPRLANSLHALLVTNQQLRKPMGCHTCILTLQTGTVFLAYTSPDGRMKLAQ
jgi:hypothetical protein